MLIPSPRRRRCGLPSTRAARCLCSLAFGGPGRGVRKKAEGEMEHRLFSFLTCEANGVVAPIHPKAMPVNLTTPDEIDTWLTAPTEIALQLQRPLPDDALRIAARGERNDEASGLAA